MAAMVHESVIVVVRTQPRAISLAMITKRKSIFRFPIVSYNIDVANPKAELLGCAVQSPIRA